VDVTRCVCYSCRESLFNKAKDESVKKSLNVLRGKANEVVVRISRLVKMPARFLIDAISAAVYLCQVQRCLDRH
jgi:hypothetical protein